MCSLVRYHEHLFCQFPFTKCLYFLNLSCISASAFIHLLCHCIKYQTYQNICMNQLFPSTRITTLNASQDASMIDLWLAAHVFHEKSVWPWIHFPSCLRYRWVRIPAICLLAKINNDIDDLSIAHFESHSAYDVYRRLSPSDINLRAFWFNLSPCKKAILVFP